MRPVRYPQLRAWFEARFQERGPRYGPAALAEELGLNRQTTSRWANSENAPDFYWLYRLAYHFQREPAEVFQAVSKARPISKFDSMLEHLSNGADPRALLIMDSQAQ